MGDVVGDIARDHPVGDGHRPVGADGQDPHQLAQIGPVVLVVTEGNRGGRLAAPETAVRLAIVPGEGDAGGVVVQLGAVDPESPHRAQDHLGQQAGPIGVEEPVQAAADAIIVEQLDLAGVQTQKARIIRGGPLAERVDRLVVHDQVAHHHPQGGRWGQAKPAIVAGHMAGQGVIEADPAQEVVHDRQGAHAFAAQLEAPSRSLNHEP